MVLLGPECGSYGPWMSTFGATVAGLPFRQSEHATLAHHGRLPPRDRSISPLKREAPEAVSGTGPHGWRSWLQP